MCHRHIAIQEWRRVLAGAVVSTFLAGCLSLGQAILIDVPFHEQPPNRCGAASVGMVAQYLGVVLDWEALDREVYIPALAGTVPELMAEGARKQGLLAQVEECTEADLQKLLEEGVPPILLLAPAGDESKGHFAVATGLNLRTGALRVHSGRERNRWMSRKAWQSRWVQAGRCVVVVRRP